MNNQWQNYSLAELRSHSVHVFREGGGSRPDVLLIEINGEKAVLKDQSAADPLFATIVGPLLNWRETKGLRKLASAKAVPNLLAVPSRRSFLMTHHESTQIRHLDAAKTNWAAVFESLTHAVNELHDLGVAHNDLRNPSNTLITPQGEPILVDLVACFCQGSKWNLINQWIYNKFCQVDRSAITKMKSRFAPHLLDDSDLHAEEIAGKAGMFVRGIGQWIRRLSRLIFTK